MPDRRLRWPAASRIGPGDLRPCVIMLIALVKWDNIWAIQHAKGLVACTVRHPLFAGTHRRGPVKGKTMVEPTHDAGPRRKTLRIIIPAYPAFNIYSAIARVTSALGPVSVATAVQVDYVWP